MRVPRPSARPRRRPAWPRPLGPGSGAMRHVFTWRGEEWDQRERWFIARVAHFEPNLLGIERGREGGDLGLSVVDPGRDGRDGR